MFERFTDKARRVLQLANTEAQRLNHEAIDIEHLLLGLISKGNGVAESILHSANIDLDKLRRQIEELLQPRTAMVIAGRRPFTPRAKKVLDDAVKEARQRDDNYVGTEHLLLALVSDEAMATRLRALIPLELVKNDLNLVIGTKYTPTTIKTLDEQDINSILTILIAKLQGNLSAAEAINQIKSVLAQRAKSPEDLPS